MKQCLGIAFWTLLLTVYLQHLQAKSIPSDTPRLVIGDLRFDLLRNNVVCNDSVTFQTPTVMTGRCLPAVVRCMVKGLEDANSKCQVKEDVANFALDVLDNYLAHDNVPVCDLEGHMGSQTYEGFLNATEQYIRVANLMSSS